MTNNKWRWSPKAAVRQLLVKLSKIHDRGKKNLLICHLCPVIPGTCMWVLSMSYHGIISQSHALFGSSSRVTRCTKYSGLANEQNPGKKICAVSSLMLSSVTQTHMRQGLSNARRQFGGIQCHTYSYN